MNNKEKQIQQVPIQMHPIIRNPEAISDDQMQQVQVPQMQPAAQVQVPSNTEIHNLISDTYMCRVLRSHHT